MTPLSVYEDRVDSGLAWLDQIPSHWQLRPLGSCFIERRETVSDKQFLPLSVTMGGIVPQLENAAKTGNGDNRKRVAKGDFVINSRSDRKGSSGLSDLDGSVSLISTVLTPRADLHPKFVHYLLRSRPFQEEYYRFGTGIAADLWSTRYSNMKRILLPIPPRQEQQWIVSFLDSETAQVDELIAKQQKLIELLAEKRQAVITQAITKGLDPSAPTKPSGTAWLGEIPAHWAAGRIKDSVARIEQGVSPQADSTPAPACSWGVLKSGCVNGGIFRENENKQLPDDFVIPPEYVVHLGDLLVSRASGSPKLVGSAARIRNLSSRLILSDKTFRFVTRNHVNADFLEWFLNSQPYRKQVIANISGAEGLANNISVSALKNIRIALPPQREQTAIVQSVNKKIEKLNTLESTASRAIELLKERRSALISAAVTGKIDVREGAA